MNFFSLSIDDFIPSQIGSCNHKLLNDKWVAALVHIACCWRQFPVSWQRLKWCFLSTRSSHVLVVVFHCYHFPAQCSLYFDADIFHGASPILLCQRDSALSVSRVLSLVSLFWSTCHPFQLILICCLSSHLGVHISHESFRLLVADKAADFSSPIFVLSADPSFPHGYEFLLGSAHC